MTTKNWSRLEVGTQGKELNLPLCVDVLKNPFLVNGKWRWFWLRGALPPEPPGVF